MGRRFRHNRIMAKLAFGFGRVSFFSDGLKMWK